MALNIGDVLTNAIRTDLDPEYRPDVPYGSKHGVFPCASVNVKKRTNGPRLASRILNSTSKTPVKRIR